MSCKICGRNSCTESFHSIEEQSENEPEYLRDRIAALTAERDRYREALVDIADSCWPKDYEPLPDEYYIGEENEVNRRAYADGIRRMSERALGALEGK